MSDSATTGHVNDLTNGQKIPVHPDTHKPTRAWDILKVKQVVNTVQPLPPDTPVYPDKVRFVCVSDTHNRTSQMPELPPGDVLLHAGDFSNVGQLKDIEEFNTWLGSLPYLHKVVICGNHDITFDHTMISDKRNWNDLKWRFSLDGEKIQSRLAEKGVKDVRELLTNCTYIEDSETQVYGIRIYGSPWQPWFHDWGYNLERGQPCLDKWNLIPEDVDILITHGPPIGHGDRCFDGQRAGCVELLSTIQQRVRPKYHVYGHIHEGYGVTTDGKTTFINASTCTLRYRPTNPPIIFDLPLPEGQTKE